MAKETVIVRYINAALIAAINTAGSKSYGITEIRTKDELNYPAETDQQGESHEVSIDDSLPVIIYHRSYGSSINKDVSSFGDDQDLIERSNLSVIVFAQRKKIGMNAAELKDLILDSIPDSIDDAALLLFKMKSCYINSTSSDINSLPLYSREYGDTPPLNPEFFIIEIKYTVESKFDKSCLKDSCCETDFSIFFPTNGERCWVNNCEELKEYIDAHAGGGGLTCDDLEDCEIVESLQSNIDDHIADTSNPHNVTKAQVGLGSVDNTSDVNKPVSTAQGSADAAVLAAAEAYADSLVVGLWDDRGNFDASVNVFPSSGGSGTAGAILKGDIWTVSVAGTLGGIAVAIGDTVRALTNTPAQTSSNWAIAENNIGYVPENAANKDASGGYVGLTLFKINFKNALNTITSFLTNSNTVARTYTFQDRDGTIADDTDITNAKARANHTGTQLASTISDFNSAALAAAPAETAASIGTLINGSGAATPNDTDLVATAESSVLKKITWTSVKAFLKTYFDTTYVSSTLTNGNILVGNGSNVATSVTSSGDVTISNAGVQTIGANKVTYQKTENYIQLAVVSSFLLTTNC